MADPHYSDGRTFHMDDLGKAIRERVTGALRRAGVSAVGNGGAAVRVESATGSVGVGDGYAVVDGLYWMTQDGDVIRDDVLHRDGRRIAGTPVPNRGARCRVEIHMGNMWINGAHIPEYRGGRGGSSDGPSCAT